MKTLQDLLDEADNLYDRASKVQTGHELTASAQEIRILHSDYQQWFAEALGQLPPELKEKFRDAYEGGKFVQRIKAFLVDPEAKNSVYQPGTPDSPFPYWRNPFNERFSPNFHTQRALLVEASESVSTPSGSQTHAVDTLCAIAERIPLAIRVLRGRKRDRADFEVNDEYDLQDLTYAVLVSVFDDVRPEETTPSYAGKSSRTDFLLKRERIFIEMKMTRESLNEKKVRDELIVDIASYRTHPDCDCLVAVVYDPGFQITNRTAFQDDLSGMRDGLRVFVFVVS